MKRRNVRVAVPFVIVVSAGCAKSGETTSPVPTPTTSATTSAPTTAAPPPADATALVFEDGTCYRLIDGEKKYVECPESVLPKPPADQLVYKNGTRCNRVPDGAPVQCPTGGPTATLPEPSSIKTATGSISLQYGSLKCLQGVDVQCPPDVNCNPPPPKVVPCPAALLPKLTAGVKPTKKEQERCWFGAAEVACPAP